MKLATLKNGSRDGALVLVSRDLRQYQPVPAIAATLQAALDDWDAIAPQLEAAYAVLNAGQSPDAQPFDTIASYGLLNLRLEWNQMRGAPLDLAIYGTNVLDKAYRITANTGYNNSGFSNSIYGEPAQYGLSLRYRF